MTRFMKSLTRRFWSDEDGATNVVEFALWSPIFIGVILSGIELAAITVRHTALERALDETVRDIRLGKENVQTSTDVKQLICDRAGILPSCVENLELEMVQLSPRDWQSPPDQAQCVDTTGEIKPAVSFSYGKDNELMFLRACYRFKPIAPTSSMGESVRKDTEGYSAIISTSAFVQEPG